MGINCQQNPICHLPAAYRYTWPGQDESFICAPHGGALLRIAAAMGIYLQLIQLTDEDHERLGTVVKNSAEGA